MTETDVMVRGGLECRIHRVKYLSSQSRGGARDRRREVGYCGPQSFALTTGMDAPCLAALPSVPFDYLARYQTQPHRTSFDYADLVPAYLGRCRAQYRARAARN